MTQAATGRGKRQRTVDAGRAGRGRSAVRTGGIVATSLGAGLLGLLPFAADSLGAGAAVSPRAILGAPAWTQQIHDTTGPVDPAGTINMSSPNLAQLPGGPAVVVGDRSGDVYAYALASGTPMTGWPYSAGAPVQSTPSVAPLTAGSSLDTVFVGTGDATTQGLHTGGYQAITPQGGDAWFTGESDPSGSYGVQASMSVGVLQGGLDVTAGSLGQNQYAMNAGNGAVLPGFPWFQADTSISTPAIADLYVNGINEIVEGGASSAGLAYNTTYTNGGHIRVLAATGNAGQAEPNQGLDCQYNANEQVDSSPAVGEFLGGGTGIVVGTGDNFNQSDTDKLIAVDAHCNLAWEAPLDGVTTSSPALADVLGNGQLQVVEGTNVGDATGTVYALNGSNGQVLWQTNLPSFVAGSVVTADLGSGYQDVIVATGNGAYILDGKTGSIVQSLLNGYQFANAPLVTDEPDGALGITFAGTAAGDSDVIHYEVAGSNGSLWNDAGAWPMFHHDPQLTGDAGTSSSINVPCNVPSQPPYGYELSASDGGIFNFGNIPFCGSTGGIVLNKPVVGTAITNNGGGYWEVASDGGIFSFGDAKFWGSTGNLHLNQPMVGMAATPDDGGYWLVAADGGIFSFGNAQFYGSTGNLHLNKPIVGMAALPDGRGYWLVASDGGVFSFGDAKFWGSTGNIRLNQPVVGMAANPVGTGYWLVAADGGVFSFGSAPFYGSTGNIRLNEPIVGMEAIPSGRGYRFVAADGGVFDFGDAQFFGSTGNIRLNKPIVGLGGF